MVSNRSTLLDQARAQVLELSKSGFQFILLADQITERCR